MKIKISAIITLIVMLFCQVTAVGLGDNPPIPPSNPNYSSIGVSPVSHTEGATQAVTVNVATVNVQDGTAISAQLVNGDGTPVNGVNAASGTVNTNTAVLVLSIPAGTAAGTYKIKVSMSALNLHDSGTAYTIQAGAQPGIASVTPDSSSHTAGVQKKIKADIITTNVNNGTSATVQLVDGNLIPVNGVSMATGSVNNNFAQIEVTIPSTVSSGNYRIKATVGSVSNTDAQYTINAASSNPAINEVLTSSTSQNTGETKTINITVKTQLVQNETAVRVNLVKAGQTVAGVNESSGQINDNTAVLPLTIPGTVLADNYFIKVEVTGINEAHATTLYRVVQLSPAITGISTSGANLVQGSISGNLTITGANFSQVAAGNTIEIIHSSGGAVAASLTPSSASATSLTAAIPVNLTASTYNVRVTVGGKTVTSSGTFTVAPAATPTPTPSQTSGGSTDSAATASPNTNQTPVPGNIIKTQPVLSGSTATVEVTEADLEEAFKNAEADESGYKKVMIEVPEVDGATEYIQHLSASMLTSAEKDRGIELKTSVGAITMPSNMFKASELAGAAEISISLGIADTTALSGDLREQIGDKPVLELKAFTDGKAFSWSNSNAQVTVSINYTPTADELKDPEHIVIWYIDGSGKVVPVPSGRYDIKTGKVTFTTSHFSKYAIAYQHKTFKDIEKSYARKMIEVLASKGIINGTSADTYDPALNVTRADFMVLLVKSLSLNAEVDGNFVDIKPSDYYYNAVGIAKKLGITGGIGSNKYDPKAKISRQDMMVLTARAMSAAGKITMAGSDAGLEKFNDAGSISSYAKVSIATLVKAGIIGGSGGRVYPRDTAKRDEIAAMVYRIYNYN